MSFIEKRLVRKGDVGPDEVRLEIPVALLTDAITSAAAAAAGTIYTADERYLISSDLLACAKAVYFEASVLGPATTGAASAELYDVNAATVRASLSIAAAENSPRKRSADIKASLVAGNEVVVRLNITTTLGSGETAKLRMARLVIVAGIS